MLLFLLPFCAVGIVSAALSVRSAWRGNWGEAGFFLVFALVFGGAGFGLLAWTAHAARIKRSAIGWRRATLPSPGSGVEIGPPDASGALGARGL